MRLQKTLLDSGVAIFRKPNNDELMLPKEICAPVKNDPVEIKEIALSQETKDFILSLQPKDSFKKILWSSIIGSSTLLIGMASVLVVWSNNNANLIQQERLQEKEQNLNIEISRLKDSIEKKNKKMELFNIAVSGLRGARDKTILACQLGLRNKPNQMLEYDTMRIEAREALGRTTYGMDNIFKDNPNIRIKAYEVNVFDEGVRDVCQKHSPSEEAWRSRQRETTKLMEQSIAKDEEEIKKALAGNHNKI